MSISHTEHRALLAAHIAWEEGDGAMPDDIRILRHRRWIKKQSDTLNPHYEWTPSGLAALSEAKATSSQDQGEKK